jgi:hypothetical protein
MQNLLNCSIRTITDHSGDAISYGSYINYDGQPVDFSYCGSYTGLKQSLKAVHDVGGEVVHRVERLGSVAGWLAHEVEESMGFVSLSGLSQDHYDCVPSGFALQSVWGSVVNAVGAV